MFTQEQIEFFEILSIIFISSFKISESKTQKTAESEDDQ